MMEGVVHDEAQLNECIDWCLDCERVCSGMFAHCLKRGHAHADPDHIQRLMDCAEICRASASFLMRGSSFVNRLVTLCAEMCLTCAEGCERLGDDESMQHCAGVCRACADSCQRMVHAVA